MKSGNLNLLEPSGPVQPCNGKALPFFFMPVYFLIPVPVDSKVQVCGRSIAGIAGSKLAECMDISLLGLLFVVSVAASVTS
jgi:hypothetical protein